MSVIIQTRGEAGGGVAAHLQCPHCGHFSKSHAQQLTHMATTHPASLDGVAVGRLGNILMYQSGGRLFHCCDCFHTSRDFTKLYKHIITKHCMDEKEGGARAGEGGDEGSEKGEEEEEGDGVREALKRKKSSEGEDDEEERDEDALKRKKSSGGEEEEGTAPEPVKPEEDGDKTALMCDGGGYRCLICGWRHKQKAVGVSHVVRKHDIPKAYASQAIRRDAAMPSHAQGGGAEDDEGTGMSEEMLKEEMKATAKVVRFISSRFVCLICGWKTKLKGFAISHVVRNHEVERPYGCKDCSRSFFLPSRLQQHIRAAHRPGRYACPFCCFRSQFLGGFRRHCSRCNAREEEGGEGGAGGGGAGMEEDDNEEEEAEERKETRGVRKRRSSGRQEVEERQEVEDEDD